MLRGITFAAVLAASANAAADNGHLVYGELLGKGGAYGVGGEVAVYPNVVAGVAVSALFPQDERLIVVSPYAGWTPLRWGRHGVFGHLGMTVVEHDVDSPVAQWDGNHDVGVGAQLAGGYEYRGPVVIRTSLVVTAGAGGVVPWAGITVGLPL